MTNADLITFLELKRDEVAARAEVEISAFNSVLAVLRDNAPPEVAPQKAATPKTPAATWVEQDPAKQPSDRFIRLPGTGPTPTIKVADLPTPAPTVAPPRVEIAVTRGPVAHPPARTPGGPTNADRAESSLREAKRPLTRIELAAASGVRKDVLKQVLMSYPRRFEACGSRPSQRGPAQTLWKLVGQTFPAPALATPDRPAQAPAPTPNPIPRQARPLPLVAAAEPAPAQPSAPTHAQAALPARAPMPDDEFDHKEFPLAPRPGQTWEGYGQQRMVLRVTTRDCSVGSYAVTYRDPFSTSRGSCFRLHWERWAEKARIVKEAPGQETDA